MTYYRHTFLNGDQALRDRGLASLESVKENLAFWAEYGTDPDSYDGDDQEIIDQFSDLGSFYEYGLCFDFCGPSYSESEGHASEYFRYQLSWGGPSDEIRFYPSGMIEYVFLDWFVGVGFDVTKDVDFSWARDWFQECGSLDFSSELQKWDDLPCA